MRSVFPFRSIIYGSRGLAQSTISAKVFESMKHQILGPLIIDQCKFVYKTNITATIVEGGGAGLKKAKTLQILITYGHKLRSTPPPPPPPLSSLV